MDDEDTTPVRAWGFVFDKSELYQSRICIASVYLVYGLRGAREHRHVARCVGRSEVAGLGAVAGLGERESEGAGAEEEVVYDQWDFCGCGGTVVSGWTWGGGQGWEGGRVDWEGVR